MTQKSPGPSLWICLRYRGEREGGGGGGGGGGKVYAADDADTGCNARHSTGTFVLEHMWAPLRFPISKSA